VCIDHKMVQVGEPDTFYQTYTRREDNFSCMQHGQKMWPELYMRYEEVPFIEKDGTITMWESAYRPIKGGRASGIQFLCESVPESYEVGGYSDEYAIQIIALNKMRAMTK
jgi:hypothetical protein